MVTFYLLLTQTHNFFHWFLDVLQKLEFASENKNEILNSKIKIIIPNGHDNSYVKISLETFNLHFTFKKKRNNNFK